MIALSYQLWSYTIILWLILSLYILLINDGGKVSRSHLVQQKKKRGDVKCGCINWIKDDDSANSFEPRKSRQAVVR